MASLSNVFQAFSCNGKAVASVEQQTTKRTRNAHGNEEKIRAVVSVLVKRDLGTASPDILAPHVTPSPSAKRRTAKTELPRPPKGVPEKLGVKPLRLIVIGHNPSEHAWRTGHYYSNPSNRMWPILISTGIAYDGATGPEADDEMPNRVGVGFTDVGSGNPGTNSADFKSPTFVAWGADFYSRLSAHMRTASTTIGCTCAQCGAPAIVAFSGKRQYLELLNLGLSGRARQATVALGPQSDRPPGWPLPRSTEVWVMTSTSGASALSNAVREAPWRQLAARLAQVPWPRDLEPSCRAGDRSQPMAGPVVLKAEADPQAGTGPVALKAWPGPQPVARPVGLKAKAMEEEEL